MKSLLSAFGCGLLFGLGLVVSGMTQTANVLGFLDVFGTWLPALAAVMGSAVLVFAINYRWICKLRAPAFDTQFHLPTKRRLDARLWLGAAIFGIGWGFGGFCPGPGLVGLGSGSPRTPLFVVAFLVGVLAAKGLQRKLALSESSRGVS